MKNIALLTTLLALGAGAGPTTASASAPSGNLYDVTVNGRQTFDQTTVDPESRQRDCWDTRGTITQSTVAGFKSTNRMRVRIIKQRDGKYRFAPIEKTLGRTGDWDIDVDMAHKGSTKLEGHPGSCDRWVTLAPPDTPNCSAKLTDWGGNIGPKTFGRRGGVVSFSGRDVIPVPTSPFAGCPYGDQSRGLYRAD